MKIVIAIDSLKGSLSSYEAGTAIKEGILQACPQDTVVVRPLADGGEGTVDALVEGLHGEKKLLRVHGPLTDDVACKYGIIAHEGKAILEMAEAAGLNQVPAHLRNPLYTTTYGVGQVIAQAISDGIRKFIIGIGGSATSDCGLGMLQALGYVFCDADGQPVGPNGIDVERVVSVDDSHVLPELADCEFRIACDVNNPLYGDLGAPAIYGPQKGATPEIVARLDAAARSFAGVTARYCGHDWAHVPGAGAAGGLGFAFLAYLHGQLQSGIQIILDEINLDAEVQDADVVITGEGRLDRQTAMGKAPIGVAKLGKKYGATVLAFAGCVSEDARQCNTAGIDAFFPIPDRAMSLEEAMNSDEAYKNMTNTAEQVFRLIRTLRA